MITSSTAQITDFSRDVMGRFICNGLDEARRSADDSTNPNARPFDVIVIGGGACGSIFAHRIFFQDARRRHRVLVLEAGPFLLPEHVQNLPLLGLQVPSPTRIGDLRAVDQDRTPRNEVWGVPWHSTTTFPGLAYCLGGGSLFWGGWSPQPLETEMPAARWPQSVVNDLNHASSPNRAKSYLRQAGELLGVDVTKDFIFGKMHKALRELLLKGIEANRVTGAIPLSRLPIHLDAAQLKPGEEALSRLEAPLAVQGTAPRTGSFLFTKFSAAPMLIEAARVSQAEAEGDDARRRLMVVPNCHVKRLVTAQEGGASRVIAIETNQGNIPVPPNGTVVIALGTIESARLALNSFHGIPSYNQIGKNLMGHLRSNLTIRIPREALPQPDQPSKEPQVSALLVRGRRQLDGEGGHFHLQITAVGLGPISTESEAQLFKEIPDIETFELLRAADDKSILITIRAIGEMEAQNPNSFVRLDPEVDEYGLPRAFVSIQPSARELALWDAMDQATDDAARVLANGKSFEVLTPRGIVRADAGSDLRQIVPYTPSEDPGHPGRRDSLGSSLQEAGTLQMGEDSTRGVTNTDGQFHHVPNAYVAGPALFPTAGSPDPMLTSIALIRRTVDRILPPAPAGPEPGFQYLFDGTQTTRRVWQAVGQGSFELIDGAIVVQPGGDLGLLYYPQGFGDFILRLQFRLNRMDDSSGVLIRSRNPRLAVPRRSPPHPAGSSDLYHNPACVPLDTGFKIQIDELARGSKHVSPPEPDGMDKKRTGAIYDIPTTPGSFQQSYQRGAGLVAGQWNDLEIEVRKGDAGDIYAVRLNGQQTTSYTNTDGYRGKSVVIDPDSGFLGLQAHIGRVAFRNIRIRLV